MAPFKLSLFGGLILSRSLPALVAILLAIQGGLLGSGICLVLAVWADVLVGLLAQRRRWDKARSEKEIEGFVDFICFVLAPAVFVLVLAQSNLVRLLLIPFLFAGLLRIVRFNLEGVDETGRYPGLPVTYNGYWFPLLAAACHFSPSLNPVPAFAIALPVLAGLMISTRLRIPEF